MADQVSIQLPKSAVSEGSAFTATVNFRDRETAAASTPATVEYKIYNRSEERAIKGWTRVTAGASIEITVGAGNNTLFRSYRKSENFEFLIAADRGMVSEVRGVKRYKVQDVEGDRSRATQEDISETVQNNVITSPAADDLVHLIDVSDKSGGADGTPALTRFDEFGGGGGGAEVNDLTAAVTWDDIPDGNVPESAVTQHEAALTIIEGQITGADFSNWNAAFGWGDHDLVGYLTAVQAGDIDAEASTDGWVLTSDGAGNAAWEAVAAGGGNMNDGDAETITALHNYTVGNTPPGAGSALTTDMLFLDGKEAIDGADAFLRLNQEGDFASGIYTPGNARIDGTLDLRDPTGVRTVTFIAGAADFDITSGNSVANIDIVGFTGNVQLQGGVGLRIDSLGSAGNVLFSNDGATLLCAGTSMVDVNWTGLTQFTMVNYSFNVDQTVGAGQDGFTLSYNHSSGEIELSDGGASVVTWGPAGGTSYSSGSTSGFDSGSVQSFSAGAIFEIEETAAMADPAAGFGRFWVRNDVPNVPMFTDDAGDDFELVSAGGGVTPSPGVFRDTGSTNITGVPVTIALDAETDPDANYTLAAGVITVSAAGYYSIGYSIPVDEDGIGGGTRGRVTAYVDQDDGGGAVIIPQSYSAVYTRESSGGTGLSSSFIVLLAASDELRLRAVQDGSAIVDISSQSGQAQLSIHKIRDA